MGTIANRDAASLLRPRAAAILTGIAFASLPTPALANAYQDLHQSAQGLGTAYAVNGTGIDDISAMFSNPASLARFPGTWASGAASAILPRDTFDGLAATAPFSGAPVAGTPARPRQFLDNTVGAAGYFSYQFGDRLFFGVALSVPFATKSNYPVTAASRYTAVDTQLRAYNLNPVLTWRVSDSFAIGGGPALQLYTSDFSTAVDPTGGVAASPSSDLVSRIEAHDPAIGYILGAEWQATPGTRIGASFRSAIRHHFDGDLKLGSANPTSFARLDAAVFAATGTHLTGPTAHARFAIATPSIATFGISQRVGGAVELYGSASLVGWHVFDDTRITYDNGLPPTVVDNDWHDNWYLAAGGSYRASEHVTVRAGAAYDWTPTPDAVRNPRAPNADRVYVGAGLTYRPRASWKIDLAYGHCFFDDARIALAGGNNLPRGTLNGTIAIDADILMAQLTVNLARR